ncbi:MAG TPA: c-type cytochrome domain-containing protein, partial [Candidatus Marinimicrobia bacterium]|nr:c-type cytochrome domain-containing protein [Candidatus Neomarinimicrobiota bacterium]
MKKMIWLLLTIGIVWGQVDYTSQVQTIFTASCTSCHDYGHSSGLNLTSYSGVMAGGSSGAAVEAGDHASSLLWDKVNSGAMPPGNNPDLSSNEIDLIAQWIDEGALETTAVDVTDLFFSEYAEGSSNNKYLEIYNSSDASVDLSAYSISTCSNGCDATGEFDYPDNV